MGVGFPRDILEAVAAGMDMFDCVLSDATGGAWPASSFEREAGSTCATRGSRVTRRPSRSAAPARRAARASLAPTCATSSGWRRVLGHRLLTLHNLYVYVTLMRDVREAIAGGTFPQLLQAVREADTRDRSED